MTASLPAEDFLASCAVDPDVFSLREAYRAFGAKPQRTRNSLEALTRRAGDRLSRHPEVDVRFPGLFRPGMRGRRSRAVLPSWARRRTSSARAPSGRRCAR